MNKQRHKKIFIVKYLTELIVATIGILLSLGIFSLVDLQLEEKKRAEFEWVANNRNGALKEGIENALMAVTSLQDLFQSTHTTLPWEFHHFSRSLRNRYQGIQSLMWTTPSILKEKSIETPVGYFEPKNGPLDSFITNLLKSPKYKALFKKSLESKKMVISHRLPLGTEEKHFGFLAISPILPPDVHPADHLNDREEKTTKNNKDLLLAFSSW